MKKLVIICLALVIALGSMGAAYAAWSQTLTIGGAVATGRYDVAFDSFSAPVGSYGALFGASEVDSHTWTISCTNLYPGLDATFDFDLRNTGTVPGRITDVLVNGSSVVAGAYQAALDLPVADGNNDITVEIQGITTGLVLDPDETLSGHLVVHTWLLSTDGNDASPEAAGSFTVEIETRQAY